MLYMRSGCRVTCRLAYISNWYKHCVGRHDEEKWIGQLGIGNTRLLAQIPSTSIEYCEAYKFPLDPGSWFLVPMVHCLYLPNIMVLNMLLEALGWYQSDHQHPALQ